MPVYLKKHICEQAQQEHVQQASKPEFLTRDHIYGDYHHADDDARCSDTYSEKRGHTVAEHIPGSEAEALL